MGETGGTGSSSGRAPQPTLHPEAPSRLATDVTEMGDEGSSTSMELDLAKGTVIGRYVIMEPLGAGGMGVVYSAFDPELDRKVALKLLRSRADDSPAATRRRERLVREAQALARLAHPNVVTVHDVGTLEHGVFLAMEFVDGVTLDRWIETPRSVSDIVDVISRAGHGLAEAHAAGLVHRDFKPANVMIDRAGRVRVLDFGLAVLLGDVDDTGELAESAEIDGDRGRQSHTVGLQGTPAYMAPELLDGAKAGARSDQFSFCVTLYESLYRQRPFAGETFAEIGASVARGVPRDPPPGTRVPAWLHRAVLRGLLPAPADRWPSMDALLGELTRDRGLSRRWLLGSTGVIAVSAVAWGVHQSDARERERCRRDAEGPQRAWLERDRDSARKAILATELSYAESTATRVDEAIGSYFESWAEAHLETCTAPDRTLPSELRSHRYACLDERRGRALALVEVLVHADIGVVENAAQAVAQLPPIGSCRDAQYLTKRIRPPDDPQVARQVEVLSAKLVETIASYETGRFDEALAIAEPLAIEAETLGYAPLSARIHVRVGLLERNLGRFASAEEHFRRAYWLALGSGHAATAVIAASELIMVVGYDLGRTDAGHEWAFHARALLERPAVTDSHLARYHARLGQVLRSNGENARAREHLEQAVMLHERFSGRDSIYYAKSVGNLAIVLRRQGDYERAKQHHALSLQAYETALGPDHPDVAYALNNYGVALRLLGQTDEALAAFERSITTFEAAMGPDHPGGAFGHTNLASVLLETDQPALALEHNQRAVSVRSATHGARHPMVTYSLADVGDSLRALGRFDEALRHLERAVAHGEIALGPKHQNLGETLTALGETLLDMGRAEPALLHLERAARLQASGETPPFVVARTQFRLARAIWEAGSNRRRATELAGQAAATLTAMGLPASSPVGREANRVFQWLADHSPSPTASEAPD